MKLRSFAKGLCLVGLAVVLMGAPVGHGSGNGERHGQGHGEGPLCHQPRSSASPASKRRGARHDERLSERQFSDAKDYATLWPVAGSIFSEWTAARR